MGVRKRTVGQREGISRLGGLAISFSKRRPRKPYTHSLSGEHVHILRTASVKYHRSSALRGAVDFG